MYNQLHIISTGKQSLSQFVQIMIEIHPYIDYVHVREKRWTAIEYVKAIEHLVTGGVPLQKIIVNDRIDIAHIMDCYGVQLTSHSADLSLVKSKFPSLHFGCSIHSVDEAKEQEKNGAHFLLYGHIYETLSKENIPPRGLASLKAICQAVDIPVIAIGGIKRANVHEVVQVGAQGIAVLSGVLLATDPLCAVMQYRTQLNQN